MSASPGRRVGAVAVPVEQLLNAGAYLGPDAGLPAPVHGGRPGNLGREVPSDGPEHIVAEHALDEHALDTILADERIAERYGSVWRGA